MALDLCKNFISAQYLENKWTVFHQILYMHQLILTRSSLALLAVIFCSLVTALWPLIYVRILIPFNILITNGRNLTKLYIIIYIDKILVGIVTCYFLLICNRVMALD